MDAPRQSIIFYSWQSDLPDATDQTLIQTALENAAKRIRTDAQILVEPVIDRDTAGVPGAVDISTVIFSKIGHADAFVADVSFVTHYIRQRDGKSRWTPNANVMIELGYAVKHLTATRSASLPGLNLESPVTVRSQT